MAAATLPRARPATAYTHVPSFRFATPPRAAPEARARREAEELLSKDEELSPTTAKAWRMEASGEAPVLRSPSESSAVESAGAGTTFAMPQYGGELPPRLAESAEGADDRGHPDAEPSEEVPVEAPGASTIGDELVAAPLPADVAKYMTQAYDDDAVEPIRASGFKWTGVVDAAHAAWIGGTRLLRYGEVLPGGVAKALPWFVAGGEPDSKTQADPNVGQNQLCLELGMGRGRMALQLFLSGATVIGVELASERYRLAVAAFERLAHRSPEHFEISKRTADAIRIRRKGGPKGGICEVRLGNFFDVVTSAEVNAATLIFLQVCLPPPTWPRVRSLVANTSPGCRMLSYEDMERMWRGEGGASGSSKAPFPFTSIGAPRLACSWAPQKGHRFYCYEYAEPGLSEPDDGGYERQPHHGGRGSSSSSGGYPVSGARGGIGVGYG